MIIVTGTKRSGTSLWMQILIAAGIPHFGEAFPRDWESTLKEANKEGFYESMLRAGIYYATNPHPKTGAYFFPEQVEGYCVKVFIPGLVRTDRAFIGRVIASVREWREHEASLQRLYAMEDAERAAAVTGGGSDTSPPERMPPALEWWAENFALVRDISIRRYPVHAQSYDGLLRDPERVIRETITWLGRGDAARALSTPKPQHRHFQKPDSDSIPAEAAEVFDELYDTIDRKRELSQSFLLRLNECNERLQPLLEENTKRVMADVVRRRIARAKAAASGEQPESDPS
jgi:hypothetical protein